MAALLPRPPGPRRAPAAHLPARRAALTPSGVVAAVRRPVSARSRSWCWCSSAGRPPRTAGPAPPQRSRRPAGLAGRPPHQLVLPGGTFGLVPLGLTVLPVLLSAHRHPARRPGGRRPRPRGVVALTVGPDSDLRGHRDRRRAARPHRRRCGPCRVGLRRSRADLAGRRRGPARSGPPAGRRAVAPPAGARPAVLPARGRGGRGARRRRGPARRRLPGGPPRAGRRPRRPVSTPGSAAACCCCSAASATCRPPSCGGWPSVVGPGFAVGEGTCVGCSGPTSVPSRRSRCSPACRPAPAPRLVAGPARAGRRGCPGRPGRRPHRRALAGAGPRRPGGARRDLGRHRRGHGAGLAFLGWLGRRARSAPAGWR